MLLDRHMGSLRVFPAELENFPQLNTMASSADYLLTHLSENHKNQIQTFLKFSRTKRDETLKEIQAEFQDVKELRYGPKNDRCSTRLFCMLLLISFAEFSQGG